MRTLIFGGGGYVGSTLVRELLAEGHKVKVVDNFFKGNCDSLLHFTSNPNFEFAFGDVTNKKDVERSMKGIDNIILLSALVGAPICQKYPVLSHLTSVGGAKNVIKYRPKDVPLFFASTGSVYGALSELCTEDSPTNPKSEYGVDKLMAERLILDAKNTYAYRFSTAFGLSPCMRVNLLINDLVLQAYTNHCLVIFQADFKRSFISVTDMARSFIHGINHHRSFTHHLFNVGDPDGNFTKREIAEKIRAKLPCSVFYEDISEDVDQRNYAVDMQRILKTGWKPTISVDQGIDELIKAVPLLQVRNPYS